LDPEREDFLYRRLENRNVRSDDSTAVDRIFAVEEGHLLDRNYRWGLEMYCFVKEALDLVEDTDLAVIFF